MTDAELDRLEAMARSSHPWNHRELVDAVVGLCAEVRLSCRERDAYRGAYLADGRGGTREELAGTLAERAASARLVAERSGL